MRPYAGKAAIMMVLVLIGIGHRPGPAAARPPADRQGPAARAGRQCRWTYDRQARGCWAWSGALLATHILGSLNSLGVLRLPSYVGTQITYDMRAPRLRPPHAS